MNAKASNDEVFNAYVTMNQVLKIIRDKQGEVEMQMMLMMLDSDENRRVTGSEFFELIEEVCRRKDDAILEAAFKELDRNDDGFLNANEVATLF
jgi:Ca2+-binding EF-hand superfamily protein